MYFPLCLFRSQSCVPGQSILSPKIAFFTTVYTLFYCIIITILKQDQNGGSSSAFVLLLLFTRAIRNTIECTLREHSIVMNRIFDAFRCFAAPFAHEKARVNCRIQKEPLHFAMALCYVLD